MKQSFLTIVLISTVAISLSSCGDSKPKTNPANAPVPVNVQLVQPGDAVSFDAYPGTIVALKQVEIRPQTEGYVTGIFFTEGSKVRKGQKLYEIDRSKYQATYGQAQASVQVAQANLDQAQKDADRYTYLAKHDAVAKQTLDHAMTTLQNAKNQLEAAKQGASRAGTDLNYGVIKAPFDGTIGISQVRVGASVSPGQTLLNTISTDDTMAVDITINEKLIPRFVTLQQQASAPADSTFLLVLPDNTTYAQPGRIYIIDRGVNPQTGSLTVRLVFANTSSVLRSGMSCKVKVKNMHSNQIIIPNKAVTEQMGEYFVYVTKDTVMKTSEDENAKPGPAVIALQKKVKLGTTIGGQVLVNEGLEAGDELIVDGVQKLHDGSVVKK